EGERILARAPQPAEAKSHTNPSSRPGVWHFYNSPTESSRSRSETRTQYGELRVDAVRLGMPRVESKRLPAAFPSGLDIAQSEQSACKPCGRIGNRGREALGARQHLPRLRPR